MYADQEEIPWVQSLLDGFTIEGQLEWESGDAEGPLTYQDVVIDFRVTNRYFRARSGDLGEVLHAGAKSDGDGL